jgi:hypothetical protein
LASGWAGFSNHFPGSIDDVRVYQGALSDSMITALATS